MQWDYHGTIKAKMEKMTNLHNMQPNGKPHVLVQHPTFLIIHKAASEPTGKKIVRIHFKDKVEESPPTHYVVIDKTIYMY